MQLRFFAAFGVAACCAPAAFAADTPATATARFDVMAYQVLGNTQLSVVEIERAVYPFLGPQRSEADVESARAALQTLYADKGLATVAVSVPEQDAGSGLVTLQVSEQRIGRLRVSGAEYFSPDAVARGAPSLKEGAVPNFKDVQRDIVALNQLPDRRVTPDIKPGAAPNTLDVDLNVDDELPLHGSLELNNRSSANTTDLRLNATLRYDNLWQRGHSFSLSAQTAPERPSDARVFSASYLARLTDSPWSLLAYAVSSDSDVAVLSDFNVIGNGTLAGVRAIRALPARTGFFHSLSLGIDYKHFEEESDFGLTSDSAPIEYYPLNLAYNADWVGERTHSNFSATLTANTGGLGIGADRCGNTHCNPPASGSFDHKRYNARPNFAHLRLEGSHTRTLGRDFQLFGRAQTQLAAEPLISNEEMSIGGLDTVRGYNESEALGDYGVTAQLELRSPSFAGWFGTSAQEARARAFVDGGYVRIHKPLPEQTPSETLISVGIGATAQVFEHLNGSIDLAAPLSRPGGDNAPRQDDFNMLFRLWGEF
ncbi:ShlB/FhaC/HecB family hemolysin secretion/activation protein [Xanthomonas sp. AmX2]|uniref:ShlB/FhaC/HecB family hemolysin secretion/activation protein n=1 Tax=Xanthomonas sp. TaxID=29446 RepID=UPI00198034F2|nr:ShlB/FhaC/HecB family hemolysin secretion/activation protein [Xanthomonas sp.]MBN6149814.1 ShlB/FhaC/HecB family hemolysin secretion/activation protein [Xanthomonas sp.]